MPDSGKSGKRPVEEVGGVRPRKAKLERLRPDTTKRKKTEEQLEYSKKEWESTFNAISDWLVIMGLKGRILRSNRAGEEFTGIPIAEMVGQSCCKLVHGSKKHIPGCPLQKMIETGQRETKELQVPGTSRWLMVTVDPVTDEEENLVSAVHITRDITERKKTEKELFEYQGQLKTLASQLSLAEERERRRFAGIVHDHIGQNLALAKHPLQSLRKSTSGSDMLALLDKVNEVIDRTIEDAHTLTFELTNPVLYELGLEAAVKAWLAEHVRKKYGIKCEFAADSRPLQLDDDVSATLFEAVRELLVNVVEHAKARKVGVSIRKVGDKIRVVVKDNGAGFEPGEIMFVPARTGGFGLFNIRERLEYLGGNIKIKSAPGQGTKVTLTVPLKR